MLYDRNYEDSYTDPGRYSSACSCSGASLLAWAVVHSGLFPEPHGGMSESWDPRCACPGSAYVAFGSTSSVFNSFPCSPMTRRTPQGTYVLAQLKDDSSGRSLLLQVWSLWASDAPLSPAPPATASSFPSPAPTTVTNSPCFPYHAPVMIAIIASIMWRAISVVSLSTDTADTGHASCAQHHALRGASILFRIVVALTAGATVLALVLHLAAPWHCTQLSRLPLSEAAGKCASLNAASAIRACCGAQGRGASDEGNRPFLDILDVDSGETQRLWRSQPPYYENLGACVWVHALLEILLRCYGWHLPQLTS